MVFFDILRTILLHFLKNIGMSKSKNKDFTLAIYTKVKNYANFILVD